MEGKSNEEQKVVTGSQPVINIIMGTQQPQSVGVAPVETLASKIEAPKKEVDKFDVKEFTFNQVALEELNIREKYRKHGLILFGLGLAGCGLSVIGLSGYAVGFILCMLFLVTINTMQNDQRIEYLTNKYGAGKWKIWTIAKLLKRNKD